MKKNDILINFRKPKKGPEMHLIEQLINNISSIFGNDYSYEVLVEAYAEIGIPDLIVVVYDKEFLKNTWDENRCNLNIIDIKILHHIWTVGNKGINFNEIVNILGYDRNVINKVINKLCKADLTICKNNRLVIANPENAFFVKKIITIEAKISNYKKAFEQAFININYSSHSYVLMPYENINQKVKSNLPKTIGLLGQKDNSTVLTKKAKEEKIPSSYFSWVINEYIGRKHYLEYE